MLYEVRPWTERSNDVVTMPDEDLLAFVDTIPEDVPDLSCSDLRQLAEEKGLLGHAWDKWLYERFAEARAEEATQAAADNAPTLRLLTDQLFAYDQHDGAQSGLPLPQAILNVSAHTWALYDYQAPEGSAQFHDDGVSEGVHAITRSWRVHLPPEEQSWYTDGFARACAQLANISYQQKLAAGTLTCSEWQQQNGTDKRLVLAAFVADSQQAFGWNRLLDDLRKSSKTGIAAGVRSIGKENIGTDDLDPAGFFGLDGMTVQLLTLPLSQATAAETGGYKTLQIYVIQPNTAGT